MILLYDVSCAHSSPWIWRCFSSPFLLCSCWCPVCRVGDCKIQVNFLVLDLWVLEIYCIQVVPSGVCLKDIFRMQNHYPLCRPLYALAKIACT